MFCPRCENLLVVRRPSTNLLDRLFCRISIYPFQCQWCGHRFRAKQSKTRVSTDDVKRRKAYRTPVRIPVSFESREGPGEGIISDISASGCVIESKRWLRPGLLLQLQLTAGTDGEPDITIRQLGSVQWVRGDQAGVQFVALTPQRQLRLTRIIARGNQDAGR